MNCERNKKTVFIQKKMHKFACNEQFLSTFAANFKKNALRVQSALFSYASDLKD